MFLPWWSLAIVAFVLAFLLGKKASKTFLSAFFGCGIVWLFMAFYIHFAKGDLMTSRVAALLSLHGTVFLYLGSFLIAAVVGGLAALSGFFIREISKPKKLISGTW
jgi:nitrate reductase gamma subunit